MERAVVQCLLTAKRCTILELNELPMKINVFGRHSSAVAIVSGRTQANSNLMSFNMPIKKTSYVSYVMTQLLNVIRGEQAEAWIVG